MSESVLYTSKEEPIMAVVANTYPYIMIETANETFASNFASILTLNYSELTINNSTSAGNNMNVISGTFGEECDKIT